MDQHHEHSNEHDHHLTNVVKSEVNVSISYENEKLSIQVADNNGNAPSLGLTHEKEMHLIVVSNDLIEFYHLHPKKVNNGDYEMNISLSNSSYTAFVDINPKGKEYHIKPIRIKVTSDSQILPLGSANLKKDQFYKKEMDGNVVELITNPLKVGEEITLSFNIVNAIPEPYLGALGHVVVIDQDVEQFIHVHPVSEHETVFKTQFDKSGLYKLWAEFKFRDNVFPFPFIIEVK
ncbi:hypothetical protein PY093_19905 [Cytobacillus sp. S13-E01]|uniref:hypothetical protein n=1 Tax=Cytobacillus sp. S13-E01 TaxID=3031326 RepID=UPI0023D887F0|nr:hypothetical protein [Cytobacillus sp. S13-E01]MDF0728880.1 hypothetical protein [Cytobacillus sp. S13-E01]